MDICLRRHVDPKGDMRYAFAEYTSGDSGDIVRIRRNGGRIMASVKE